MTFNPKSFGNFCALCLEMTACVNPCRAASRSRFSICETARTSPANANSNLDVCLLKQLRTAIDRLAFGKTTPDSLER